MESLSQNIQVNKIKHYSYIIRKVVARFEADFSILMILFICLILTLPVTAQSISSIENGDDRSINIGLLITENPSENLLMREAVDVVNLAMDEVNESGGILKKKLNLFVASVDGNWGAGSKRAVDLISKHGATVLLGFVDGRSAHLIEQVCTKAQVPFVSAYSPDPTLSRINIPWFFSTMPHAEKQAKVMADKLIQNHQGDKISVISSDEYDQSFIRRAFLQEFEKVNTLTPNVWSYSAGEDNFAQMVSEISGSDAEVIAFFGNSEELENFILELEMKDHEIPVYTPINDFKRDQLQNGSNPIFTITPKNWDSEIKKKFHEDFYQEYGYRPGLYAPYVYDGMIAIINAIRSNGAASAQIQDALFNMNLPGVNGVISFDDSGMIEGSFVIKNGK